MAGLGIYRSGEIPRLTLQDLRHDVFQEADAPAVMGFSVFNIPVGPHERPVRRRQEFLACPLNVALDVGKPLGDGHAAVYRVVVASALRDAPQNEDCGVVGLTDFGRQHGATHGREPALGIPLEVLLGGAIIGGRLMPPDPRKKQIVEAMGECCRVRGDLAAFLVGNGREDDALRGYVPFLLLF